jgi:MerR family copper efflux transcriptional regulator
MWLHVNMKSTPKGRSWSVGELAGRFGLGTHVLRHWEDKGLLSPARDPAGRRRYGDDEVVRVAVILRSKAAGMTLDQIMVMLDAEADGRRAVLAAHVRELDETMAEMVRSREMTMHALECRAHDIATCPHFRAAVSDILEGTAPVFDMRDRISGVPGRPPVALSRRPARRG